MKTGCGPEGTSVQVFKQCQGSAWKSDSEIVQYTALRDKKEVRCSEVCQNLRRKVQTGDRTRKMALPSRSLGASGACRLGAALHRALG